MDGAEIIKDLETNEEIGANEVKETTDTTETTVDAKDEKIASLEKALNAVRAENKTLKKKQKENEDDEAEAKIIEDDIRAKLKNGKSELTDEVIDDLMNTFGKSLAKSEARTARKEVEKEIMELKRTHMDAEEYGKEIRALMKSNGLTAEQAYWVVAGANKVSEASKRKATEEKEDEEHNLNAERAKQAYINTSAVTKGKEPVYTEKEKAIAKMSNMSLEEASQRGKAFTLDEILALNERYKKGGK